MTKPDSSSTPVSVADNPETSENDSEVESTLKKKSKLSKTISVSSDSEEQQPSSTAKITTSSPSGHRRLKGLKITGTVSNEWSSDSEELPGVSHLGM